MASKKSGGRQGSRRPVKGFRPGKEPAHLKKQRAKAQLGKDASWLQKQTVDAIAGQRPEEVGRMVRRWSAVLLAGAVGLGLAGVFLYTLALWAGISVHVVAAVLLFLAYRLRKQGPGLVDMAGSL